MENNYFDKIIRAKLENLEASQKAMGWELLQHRINADPELSIPEETADPFDEIIKSKLESTNANLEPSSWELMENRINADADLSIPEMDDIFFDGIAYENLNNLETPYNATHWELMAKRIHEEFSLHHRLYKYKVLEVSLMLFAIFTLFQFLPIEKISIQKKNNTPVATSTESNNMIQQALATFPEVTTQQPETVIASSETNSSANTNTAETALSNSASTALIAQSETGTTTKPVNIVSPSFPDFSQTKQIGSSLPPTSIEEAITPLADQTSNTASAALASKLEEQSAVSATDDQSNEQVEYSSSISELLNVQTSPMDELVFDGGEYLPDCIHCKKKKFCYLRIGMMGAIDFNYVMTPYDLKFEEESYAQLFAGYSGGFSLGFQKGRWELSTGLLYNSKKYEPKVNVEYTGSLRDGLVIEGLKSAQLNIISVPFNIHYVYSRNTKWHLYGLAGSTANIAVVNHYDFKKSSVGSSRSTDPRIQQQHGEEHEGYDGFFEGGSMRDNSYFTMNVGAGAERYFSSRWSLFVQPVYQHSLFSKGLGPNKDRMNTISIFLGAKATLR